MRPYVSGARRKLCGLAANQMPRNLRTNILSPDGSPGALLDRQRKCGRYCASAAPVANGLGGCAKFPGQQAEATGKPNCFLDAVRNHAGSLTVACKRVKSTKQ